MAVEALEQARAQRGGEPQPAGRRRLRNASKAVLREPLVHFFAVGLLLFVIVQQYRVQTDLHRIVITPQRVAELADRYRAEYGSAPSSATLDQLIDHDIDEEVLYREGLGRKLDRDDEIIRRRVVQKMQFLEQDLAAPVEPSEAALETYYQTHRSQYATPATLSFSHIFFSDGTQGPAAARQRAEAALASLSNAVVRAPERGDPFPDLFDYSDFGAEQARRLFGDSELSRRLFDAPQGRWYGPLRSSYGWHLVRVQSARPGRIPPFSDVRDRVRTDLIDADQAAVNRRNFEALKARFNIVREDEARP